MALLPISLAYHRYKVVDYLPRMYEYNIVVRCKLPEEVVSYDTLITIFGKEVWMFLFITILSVAAALIALDKIYLGEKMEIINYFRGN